VLIFHYVMTELMCIKTQLLGSYCQNIFGGGGGIPSGWVWHSGGSYLHKWTIKTVNVSKCNLLDPYRYFQFHILFAPHNRTFSKTPIVHPLPLNDVCKLFQLFMFFKLNSMSIFVFCFV